MMSKNLLKILFVEDLPSDAELAVLELRKEGLRFEYIRVDTRDGFIKALKEFRPDIIISDYMMPSYNGMRALLDTREFDPFMPFILSTGSINEETAVDCIKAGATDYVIKEHLTRLPFAVKEALEQYRIKKEKRAAELLLIESEEKLQSIFSAAPVGIGLVVNRVLMEVNDTFCKMTGYTRKELIGKSSELIYATKEEFESDGTEKYRQISEKGMGSVETRIKCKNGKILNILLSSAPLDKDDLTKGVTFTSLDITEKKRVEEAFKESQHLFQTLAQVSPVGIFRTNPDGFTTFVNSRYSELTGLSYEKAMGSGWLNAVHPDDREKLKENWVSDSQSRKTSNAEYRFLRPDRSIVWVMGNALPERIDNEIVGYIGTITDITERKLSEDKLKSSEERLKILFDHAPDAYYLSDLKGNFIDGNIVAEELLGYSKNELIGKSFLKLKLLSLTQLPRAAKLLVRNSLGQSTGPDEFTLSRINGSKVTVEIITHPVKIKDQTLVLGLARDITERKRTEEAIRESEEKFKAIYQSSNDAIMLLNENGFFDCNQQTLKIFKVNTKEEFIKFTPSELSPPVQSDGKNSFEASQENISIAYRKGYNRFDWIHRRSDGEDFYAEVLLSAFNLGEERVLQATVRDITERKIAEEALQQSFAFSESLLKTIPFPMDIVDETGTVLYQNDIFNILFEGEGIEKKCWDLYRDDKKQCSNCPLIKGITIGETDAIESHGVLGNRIFDISHTGMMYQGKKAILEIFQDITERKENEQKLISAVEQAQESDRLKSAFLTNMSHEIRTPMNGIIGFTELLKEPLLTVEERQDFIQTIQISGARMLNTINSIVDMSKIESGLISVDIKETNINEKIEFTYKFFKPEVESKGLQFLFKTGLTSKEANINTDNEKVYGILTNLVRNAIKFTYKGSIEFGYDIVKTQHSASLQFFVKDTGVGIPENQKELIFERFRQGSESYNRGYEGSGLGLSICKSYVEMLGGRIWVESEENKGSTFYFTVPYNPVSEQTSAIGKIVFTENKEVQIKKLKILIVEDDEISYSLLTRVVQKISREVLHAITGVEAIEACRTNPDIDLVLMDIRMPRMNGLEATQQIRQFNKDVIIIAQTAYGFSGDCEKALEAGCNDYITKPINMTILFELIKRHCNK